MTCLIVEQRKVARRGLSVQAATSILAIRAPACASLGRHRELAAIVLVGRLLPVSVSPACAPLRRRPAAASSWLQTCVLASIQGPCTNAGVGCLPWPVPQLDRRHLPFIHLHCVHRLHDAGVGARIRATACRHRVVGRWASRPVRAAGALHLTKY